MNNRKIVKRIAFSGKAGSGKTTAANYLISKHNYKRISFAKPLYDIQHYAQNIFGFDNTKWREWLQSSGHLARKYATANGLPDPIIKIAKDSIESEDMVVIDDLRMKVELDLLKQLDFKIIRITGREHASNNMNGGDKKHITEVDLDDVELESVENVGSMPEFINLLEDAIYMDEYSGCTNNESNQENHPCLMVDKKQEIKTELCNENKNDESGDETD